MRQGRTPLFYSVAAIAIFSCLFLSACNLGKHISGAPLKKLKKVVVESPAFYLNRQIDYKTFSGKATLQINSPQENKSATATIRMHKNKDVWASIVALGMIEVARAYATPDSLFLINRINKIAYALSYKDGAKLLQADVPFSSLQNLIVGNPLLSASSDITAVDTTDSLLIIKQQQGLYTQVSGYDLSTQVLKSIRLTAQNRPFVCVIDYLDYRKLPTGEPFAFSREIHIMNKGVPMNIGVHFFKIALNQPIRTDFSIPSSYKMSNGLMLK